MSDISGGLRIQDIPLQGIDFHCSDMLDSLLMDDSLIINIEAATNLPRGKIKDWLHSGIWRYRSSINHRKLITDFPSVLTINLPHLAAKTAEKDDTFERLVLPVIDEYSHKEISKKLYISAKLLKTKVNL